MSWDSPLSGCRDATRDAASHGARRRGARGQHCGCVAQPDGSQVVWTHHRAFGMTTSELDCLPSGVVDRGPSCSRRLHRTRSTPQPRSGVPMLRVLRSEDNQCGTVWKDVFTSCFQKASTNMTTVMRSVFWIWSGAQGCPPYDGAF